MLGKARSRASTSTINTPLYALRCIVKAFVLYQEWGRSDISVKGKVNDVDFRSDMR